MIKNLNKIMPRNRSIYYRYIVSVNMPNNRPESNLLYSGVYIKTISTFRFQTITMKTFCKLRIEQI